MLHFHRRSSVAVFLIVCVGVAIGIGLMARQSKSESPSDYSRIEEGLYLGGSVDEPPSGTRAVLNLCEREDPYQCEVHRWEYIPDAAPAPSLSWLRDKVEFVDAQRKAGRPTYVHCYAGISRGCLVTTAYLMSKNQWTRDEALAFVRIKRSKVRPNDAFMDLLLEWEREVHKRKSERPMHQDKDRSSKWLIGHHGDSILRLGGYDGVRTWKTSQAEVVAPRRWPDGILEVRFADSVEDELFLIEIETYASSDLDRRVHEKLLLVDLEKGIIPDVVILVLRPKGNVRSEACFQKSSFRKSAQVASSWLMIELWKLRADDLLAAGDVGLIPWAPLTQSDLPPRQLLQQCRDRLIEEAKPSEIESLLCVTQLLGSLVYPLHVLMDIFGGERPMIESPWLEEMTQKVVDKATAKTLHAAIVDNLEARFGSVTSERLAGIEGVTDLIRLKHLHRLAATCANLDAFFDQLNS